MAIKEIVEAVEKALKIMRVPGITGKTPEIDNKLKEMGQIYQVKEHCGCASEECEHIDHYPSGAYFKWVPKYGKLSLIGEDYDEGRLFEYYVLVLPEGDSVFIRALHPSRSHTRIRCVSADEIPLWVWIELMSKTEKGRQIIASEQ